MIKSYIQIYYFTSSYIQFLDLIAWYTWCTHSLTLIWIDREGIKIELQQKGISSKRSWMGLDMFELLLKLCIGSEFGDIDFFFVCL